MLILGAVVVSLVKAPPRPASSLVSSTVSQASGSPRSGGRPFAQRRAFSLAEVGGIEAALADLGLDPADAAAAASAARSAVGDGPGEIVVRLEIVNRGGSVRLARLSLGRDDGREGVVLPGARGGFEGKPVATHLSLRLTGVRGEMGIEDFYTAAVRAGLPDVLIPQFASALAFDFDFQREVRPGDVFEAAFERQVDSSGHPVGQPRLVYVSLRTREKSRALYAFAAEGEEAGWFDGNGASAIRALMRTPVDGARVSSQFGFRIHPIKGYRKLHRGIDFAAPSGTPVYAAADGTVESGFGRGTGNFVRLNHDNGWQTRYFHLSAFAPGQESGSRVSQGQLIGRVGSTGASTGPHLHYEVHIDGAPVDPLEVETGSGSQLEAEELNAFLTARDRIDGGRAAARY
ncbi:MAG TPA: M23 family metallopeptidase [Allosphingosinicella sp.]|jgi:murein DD-endopeptidase MepM/ murein hydrolase activator NlpD